MRPEGPKCINKYCLDLMVRCLIWLEKPDFSVSLTPRIFIVCSCAPLQYLLKEEGKTDDTLGHVNIISLDLLEFSMRLQLCAQALAMLEFHRSGSAILDVGTAR